MRRWLDRRAARRCIKAQARLWVQMEAEDAEKDFVYLSAESWLWLIAGEYELACTLLEILKNRVEHVNA